MSTQYVKAVHAAQQSTDSELLQALNCDSLLSIPLFYAWKRIAIELFGKEQPATEWDNPNLEPARDMAETLAGELIVNACRDVLMQRETRTA